MDRTEKPCKYCGKVMFVAEGQEAKFHKICRKEGRRAERANKK